MPALSIQRCLLAAGLFLALSPEGARADLRFGCMAEDDHVKMAIRLEFSAALGGKLTHLTGRLLVDAPDAPPELASLGLDYTFVTQVWSDRDHVMMRLYTENVSGGPVLIRITTQIEDGAKGPLVGTYRIDQPRASGPALSYSGRAICQNKSADAG